MNQRTCGLIDLVSLGLGLAEYPGGADNIDWSIVSEEFKKHFMKAYKRANELINSNIDENSGVNAMCILDRIGYMINNNEIDGRTFEKAYEDVVNLALAELGIME